MGCVEQASVEASSSSKEKKCPASIAKRISKLRTKIPVDQAASKKARSVQFIRHVKGAFPALEAEAASSSSDRKKRPAADRVAESASKVCVCVVQS